MNRRLVFDHVCIAQIQFDAAEDSLETATAELAAVQTLFHAAKNRVLVERIPRIRVTLRHQRHTPACLNGAPHCHCAAGNQEQRPKLAPGEAADSKITQLQEDAKQKDDYPPQPGVASRNFGNADENQDHRPELEEVSRPNVTESIQ